jgi:glutamine synthetase
LIGFEIEFHVLKATGADIAPAIELPLGHYSAGGLRDPTFGCMEEALDNLNNSSIQFQQFHVEGSTGQYEIVLDPLPPMQAIDELVMAQDIIRSTFSKHGYVATMLPKPIASLDGSGSHVHISISEVEHHDCFSAGMLQHLPALCAITLPMSSSYERLQTYEAGQFVCWGTNNRLAPIRLIEKGHWEYRCADATMNYYLAVATIIAAGASGVVNQTPLLLKDISGMEKSAIGASHMPLPLNFEASLTALRASLSLWNELLGSAVVQKYLRYKEHEFEAMEKQDSALAQCLWKWY